MGDYNERKEAKKEILYKLIVVSLHCHDFGRIDAGLISCTHFLSSALAIQLIDAGIGIIKAIIEIGAAVRDAQGLPERLRTLHQELPAIESLYASARQTFQHGRVPDNVAQETKQILDNCNAALNALRVIFEEACPVDGKSNHRQRVWNGARTVFFGRNSKVQKHLLVIQKSLTLLGEKNIFIIGDQLDNLQKVIEALGQDDGSKYEVSGSGSMFFSDGGDQTSLVQHGNNNKQIKTQTYNEVHNHCIHFIPAPATCFSCKCFIGWNESSIWCTTRNVCFCASCGDLNSVSKGSPLHHLKFQEVKQPQRGLCKGGCKFGGGKPHFEGVKCTLCPSNYTICWTCIAEPRMRKYVVKHGNEVHPRQEASWIWQGTLNKAQRLWQ
ncbi:Hypothetical protein R9X50_00684700 [Acrodontium crateriforme]|uniref:NACHT-NTPase and P-loop NTPases N-terminal domain-containing protein n=1 Tax=Acrodontium crateriforme TaxID=150365 RepID=A0AAQ3M975_9PEZI|nr:Hypothetical protein R9X50_00684700 [Acrodontium crateriforme]